MLIRKDYFKDIFNMGHEGILITGRKETENA